MLARTTGRSIRLPRSPAYAFSRHFSSKKPGHDDVPVSRRKITLKPRNSRIADEFIKPVKTKEPQTSTALKQNPRLLSNDYIPFSKFPRIPESIANQSLPELLTNMLIKPEEVVSNDNKKPETLVDFSIPDKYLKSKIREQITEKDKAVVEEIDHLARSNDEKEINQLYLSVLKLYYDEDLNAYSPLPEHSLKHSLSGMINLNPHMEDIDDSYLWNLFPKDKIFGKPPFEKMSHDLDGFKKWEQTQLDALKKEQSIKESNEREFHEFQALLNNSRTFFRKGNDERKGGRRKLNRKLLKRYKELKEEGKIPAEFHDKDNDEVL